jgi:hypothetical protein
MVQIVSETVHRATDLQDRGHTIGQIWDPSIYTLSHPLKTRVNNWVLHPQSYEITAIDSFIQSYNQISASDTALQLEVSPPQTGLLHMHKVSPPWTGLQHGFTAPPAQQHFHNMGICSLQLRRSQSHKMILLFFYHIFYHIFLQIIMLHTMVLLDRCLVNIVLPIVLLSCTVALLVAERARRLCVMHAHSYNNAQCVYLIDASKIFKHSQCWWM